MIPLREQIFPSGEYPDLESILERFLAASEQRIGRACFGVAGPIIEQTCDATNLPWRLSAARIRQRFGFELCWLMNDLEANAWGIGALRDEDFAVLNAGQAGARGNASIISAGTGLGEAGLYWNGQMHRPFASEGGHTDFSPSDRLEFASVRTACRTISDGSAGNGSFPDPDWKTSTHSCVTIAPVPHRNGWPRRWRSKAWRRSYPPWRCYSEIPSVSKPWTYSSACMPGRPAITPSSSWRPAGSTWAGGIAPQILPRLQQADFMQTFCDKGRMRHLMEAMPVKVILNDKAALLGAARFAALQ